MEKRHVILLGLLILAIALLFTFSSWTNARVVAGEEADITLNVFSTISSFVVGVFIMATLAIFVIISVDKK